MFKKLKEKNLFIIIIVIVILLIIIMSILFINHYDNISGIDNYDKSYYIKEYSGDLDSNLSIFPDNKINLVDATFESSFKTGLFDSDGYIILKTKYNKNDFEKEINRLSNLNITILSSCNKNAKKYTNYINYDETSYKYPAYVTIDGFANTYEYALINKNNLEIIYVYLSYPNKNNSNYKEYLKKDKSVYSKKNTLDLYSIYNHSFDNGKSYIEYSNC